MIYGGDNFYRIENFCPPLEERLGGYGFFIKLDRNYGKELPEIARKKIQDIGKGIILRAGLAKELGKIRNPFCFMEDESHKQTFLLRFLTVSDDACGLGIPSADFGFLERLFRGEGERIIKQSVEYIPHNVDSMKQSYALLSCWLAWVAAAEASSIPLEK